MRRLGMDRAGFEPAGEGVTVKNHAFGIWSAPPLAEARLNSGWLPLAFVNRKLEDDILMI